MDFTSDGRGGRQFRHKCGGILTLETVAGDKGQPVRRMECKHCGYTYDCLPMERPVEAVDKFIDSGEFAEYLRLA